MDRDHTFDLPDLTEDFWKTVVFAQKEHPSGILQMRRAFSDL